MSDEPVDTRLLCNANVNVGFADAGFSFKDEVPPSPPGRGIMAACLVNATALLPAYYCIA